MKLDFSKEYILENEMVILRPLIEDDLKHLSEFSLAEPELWNYSLVPANGLKNLKSYLNLALQKRKEHDSYPFIVFDKRTKEYAGSTRFYDYQLQHNSVQLGYTWYGKKFQGTGLNKNCKLLMLQFAFDELGVERVEFRADASNERSIAAMKSIGCKVEGILRQNCAALTGRRDSIVLSILKNEWQKDVKKNLLNRTK
ncbi:GNAT family N-acetyltransferase [Ulvibacter antarcticus]|uniref:RimJ/RimL family protein N-acetyltransferase n=1 Tax=Ulvibacter antarcticus TaxID=442714 RepID=A0A3L9YH79_9FLAO|nr:GNAT family protein [Ulvibacter antarcticus]RMA58539.1 RimJ/RimL family protein N-acetyltransferase [Ulvibacter antarcticus]